MSIAAIILVCLFVAALCSSYFKELKNVLWRLYTLKDLPGAPRKNILFTNIFEFQTNPVQVFKVLRNFCKNYSPLYNITFLWYITVNVVTPEDSELILSNTKHNEKSRIYELLHNWLRTGLLTSTGSKWVTRRKLLTPAFHFSILQQFVTVFNEETEKLVETLKNECNKPLRIDDYIGQFTLKNITETAMGTKLNFKTTVGLEYKKAVFEIGQILLWRLFHTFFVDNFYNLLSPKYFKERRVLKSLHKFTENVITEREKNFQEIELPTEEHDVYKGKKRLAMLDLLLNSKHKDGTIDNIGIREEVDTFVFEGHDTTAAALTFALMLIANHENVQEQIFQEMTEILGDVHKKPSYNDLQEMKYMERVLKETLRLYPSVHYISRKLGQDLMTHSGYLLLKDTIVHIHIYDIHHNPDIYPDPGKFDPDRFLPEHIQSRHPFAYLPFSAGPRNCIGQRFAMLELKSALSGILANFRLEPVDTQSSIVLAVDMILRTKDGIRVKFVSRN